MADKALFPEARLKIKRADQHIEALNAVLNAFLDTDFYDLSINMDAQAGAYRIKYSTKPVPADVPLILGDVLHNLRTTLDFVVYEIAERGGGATKYTKLPFAETREKLVAAVNGGLVKVATQPVIAAILDEIKPYKGGNDALYALHDLDIMDKHQLLIPTIAFVSLKNVSLRIGTNIFSNCTVTVQAGGKLNVASVYSVGDADFEFQNKGEPIFDMVFGKGQAFSGRPIVPTLHQLSQLVSGCVDALSKAYAASG